ncbi:MAG: sensor histidine kinase [Flavobacteriales bacterium]|jgi:two-component sensor histidine kinase|nr:sensor histidine kinase [Flavobacteriales bacterium]
MKIVIWFSICLLNILPSLGQIRIPRNNLLLEKKCHEAYFLRNQHLTDSAWIILEQAKEIYESDNQKTAEFHFFIQTEKAHLMELANKDDKALKILLPLLEQMKAQKAYWYFANASILTSLVYEKNGDYKTCFLHLKNASEIIFDKNYQDLKSYFYVRETSAFRVSSQIDFAKQSLDSAEYYGKENSDTINLATTYMLHAFLYDSNRIEHLEKAFELANTQGNIYMRLMILLNLSKQPQISTQKFIEHQQLAESLMNTDVLKEDYSSFYLVFSRFYKKNGDYQKALYYSEIFQKHYLSKVFNEQKIKLEKITKKYEDEKKQLIINEQKIKIDDQKSKYHTSIIYFLSLFVLFIIILSLYFKTRIFNKRLTTKQETIKSINKELHAALTHEQTLKKELNHRVKNNLQLINSLMTLENKKQFENMINRIQSIGNIHQLMYEMELEDQIPFQEYVERMVHYFDQSFSHDQKLSWEIYGNKISLNLSTLVPIGLILNELITNSLKYAHSQEEFLQINISISQKKDESFSIHYHDNGTGILTEKHQENFGLYVIDTMVKQLMGSSKSYNNNGAHFEFSFREKVHSEW